MSNRSKSPDASSVDPRTLPEPGSAVFPDSTLTFWVRGGRGRTGGSTLADLEIQRGRCQGRRVKPLDGDLRSRTLSHLYPSKDDAGVSILDGASSPASEDLPAMKDWLGSELDLMIEQAVSCSLDLGGGDRLLQEYGRELAIGEFCRDFNVGLTAAFNLGPDLEDLYHVVEVLRSKVLLGARVLLFLNEGVIRQGQTTDGVFEPIVAHPEFQALLAEGASTILVPRLTCLDQLRERGLGFYEAAEGGLDKHGRKASPTVQHMTKAWLKAIDQQHDQLGTQGWRL